MQTKNQGSQEAPREKRVRLQKASRFLFKAFMIASLKSGVSSAFGSNPGSAFDTSDRDAWTHLKTWITCLAASIQRHTTLTALIDINPIKPNQK